MIALMSSDCWGGRPDFFPSGVLSWHVLHGGVSERGSEQNKLPFGTSNHFSPIKLFRQAGQPQRLFGKLQARNVSGDLRTATRLPVGRCLSAPQATAESGACPNQLTTKLLLVAQDN
jgi:hypothetical protein